MAHTVGSRITRSLAIQVARRARTSLVLGVAGAMVIPAVLFADRGHMAPSVFSPPPIRHVFIIVDENEPESATFGDPGSEFATLAAQGALLDEYYGDGHASNDNYIAMVSGQGANPEDQGDCPDFTDFVATGPVQAGGQLPGQGCVYPNSVKTIGDQLSAAGYSWKDYDEDMGNIPARDGTEMSSDGMDCGHPLPDAPDPSQYAVPGDGYAARHNPFVYFHSVIDNQAYCDAHVVPLGTTTSSTGLVADLRSKSTTPNYSFIVPNLCDDGHDPFVPDEAPVPVGVPGYNECTNSSEPGGVTTAAAFLATWVRIITASRAFQDNGLLIVTFDEGSESDSSSCGCNTQVPINSPEPGITGPGGGLVGTVLLSPYIEPGTVSNTHYDHFAQLASLEDIFGLSRMALARSVTNTFGCDVFTNYRECHST